MKKLINNLKKEKIIRKSKIKKQTEETVSFFESLNLESPYEILDSELTNIVLLKLKKSNLDDKGKAISNGATYVDVEVGFTDAINTMSNKVRHVNDTSVFLIPREFLGSLSILMTSHDLFGNLEKIMEFFDDDLDIHEYDFSNSLFITADRLGSDINNLELVKNGESWRNLI